MGYQEFSEKEELEVRSWFINIGVDSEEMDARMELIDLAAKFQGCAAIVVHRSSISRAVEGQSARIA